MCRGIRPLHRCVTLVQNQAWKIIRLMLRKNLRDRFFFLDDKGEWPEPFLKCTVLGRAEWNCSGYRTDPPGCVAAMAFSILGDKTKDRDATLSDCLDAELLPKRYGGSVESVPALTSISVPEPEFEGNGAVAVETCCEDDEFHDAVEGPGRS